MLSIIELRSSIGSSYDGLLYTVYLSLNDRSLSCYVLNEGVKCGFGTISFFEYSYFTDWLHSGDSPYMSIEYFLLLWFFVTNSELLPGLNFSRLELLLLFCRSIIILEASAWGRALIAVETLLPSIRLSL